MRAPHPNRPVVEALEGRQMLSGAIPLTAPGMGPTTLRTGAVTLRPSRAVATQAVLIGATAGMRFTKPVGTLSNVNGVAADFRNLHATIDWGDGTAATDGTFTRAKSVIQILGTHVYGQAGTYALTVTVSKGPIVPRGKPSTSFPVLLEQVDGSAVVAAAAMTGGVTIRPVAGQAFAATVGSFESEMTALAFHAAIDWGDGSNSSGTAVLRDDEAYDVSGTHTYAAAGAYAIHVAVNGTAVGRPHRPFPLFAVLIAHFDSTAIVADPDAVAALR